MSLDVASFFFKIQKEHDGSPQRKPAQTTTTNLHTHITQAPTTTTE